jgi:hypothetical protein
MQQVGSIIGTLVGQGQRVEGFGVMDEDACLGGGVEQALASKARRLPNQKYFI